MTEGSPGWASSAVRSIASRRLCTEEAFVSGSSSTIEALRMTLVRTRLCSAKRRLMVARFSASSA